MNQAQEVVVTPEMFVELEGLIQKELANGYYIISDEQSDSINPIRRVIMTNGRLNLIMQQRIYRTGNRDEVHYIVLRPALIRRMFEELKVDA